MEEIYFAGGCLWGVQHFFRYIPGVKKTQAGRANGTTPSLEGEYDGYAECVKVTFDNAHVSVPELMSYFFEIIDPYSLNKQGNDVGTKYRTGVYSRNTKHLDLAQHFIDQRPDKDRIVVEILPLTNYIPSADEHQDRLLRIPDDHSLCHIPWNLLEKYKNNKVDG